MAENLGASFSIDITNLKAGLAAANRAIRESESEFKAAAAGMGDWTKSQEGLEKRISTMNKTAEIQQAKVEALKKEYNRLISEGLDPTSAKAADLRIKINNETAALEKSKAEIEKNKTALEQMQAESKQAADNVESLTDKVKRQESELSDLKDRYKEVAATQGKNSDEAKALAQEITELSGDLKNNKKALDDAGEAADDFDQSLKNAEKGGISAFTVALGNLAAKAIAGVIQGLKNMGSAVVDAYKEFDVGADNVVKATGATGEAADQLKKSYKNVAKSVVGDFGDIGSALGEVNTRFGYTGQELEDTTAQFLRFADITGTDAVTAVQLVSRAMGDAGIDAGDYSAVLDDLAVAAQASGISVDKLTEYLTKYGAPMRALGFDTKESIAIFSQWEKAGVNTEIAFSGMKNAISKWSAQGKDAKQEFQKTLGTIAAAPDIASATTLAIEAFGKKAGPDLADAIQNGRFEYSDFMKIIEGSAGTVTKTYEETQSGADKIKLAMQNLRAEAGGLAENFASQFSPQIEKAIETIGNVAEKVFSGIQTVFQWIIDNGDTIAAVITGIATATAAYLAYTTALQIMTNGWKSLVIVQKAVAAAQAVMNAVMNANPIGLIIAAVAGLVAAFVVLWNKSEKFRNFWIGLWEKIKAVAEPIIKALSEWFEKAWDKIKEVWGKVSAWFADIFAKIKKTFEPFGKIISGYFEMGWKNIKVVWDLAVKYFKTIWENIKLVFSAVKSVLSGNFSGAWDSIKKIFGNTGKFFGDVWDGIKKVFGNTGEFFSKTFSGAKDKITGAFSKVGDWFKTNWKSIVAFIVNPFAGVFKYLYDNFDGFRNFVDKIVGKIKDIFKPIANWFKSKVTDPIKKFFTTTWNIIKELAAGCWNAIKAVWSVVSGWYKSKVIDPIKNFFTTAWNIIKELAAGCWNAIKAVWSVVSEWFKSKVIDPVKNFFTTAWNIIKELSAGCWNAIKAVWSAVSEWFRTKVIEPIKQFFTNLWNGIKTAAQNAWNGIKSIWSTVSGWFNTTIIQPVQTFFSNLWNSIKTAANNAWNGIKSIWSAVSEWFSESVISPVKNWFTGMWDKLKSGARDAWDGIKSVFGGVADWFKDKFSTAWQKVKDVFSTGGQVFDGIKDGIVSAFKTVVNAIIRGINKVIAIPFNAINNTLDKIRNVSIAGVEPFSGLISRFNVPQIPELATGGVVKRATRAIIGEDGKEAVVPLEKNTEWMNTLADKVADKVGGGVVVNQTNNYAQAHSRYEIYKSKQATAAAVKLALSR